MRTLAILTSGGDAPGMNAAVAACTKVARARGARVLGVLNGYEGLIAGTFDELSPGKVDGWWHRGGTALGSARSQEFRTDAGQKRAARNLKGVDGLVVIGGNGSLAGAARLQTHTETDIIGLPASIDNDIACTSTAIGVDSALNTIIEACDRISDTASSHRRVFIIEVMGRDCGYLAMATSIAAAADAVLYREQGKGEDQLVSELREVIQRSFSAARGKRRVLVIKAEGVEVKTVRLVERLQRTIDDDAPGVALRYTVLGHVVRGGNPTFRDRMLAGRLGYAAVDAALGPARGVMVGWAASEPGGTATSDPKVKLYDLERVQRETASLLDGSHPTTKRRVRMLEAVQGVLPL